MTWRMIFMSIILKKRVLSKVNFQPLHALKLPESAFACTCKQKRGSEGDMKNLFRAYVYGIVYKQMENKGHSPSSRY